MSERDRQPENSVSARLAPPLAALAAIGAMLLGAPAGEWERFFLWLSRSMLVVASGVLVAHLALRLVRRQWRASGMTRVILAELFVTLASTLSWVLLARAGHRWVGVLLAGALALASVPSFANAERTALVIERRRGLSAVTEVRVVGGLVRWLRGFEEVLPVPSRWLSAAWIVHMALLFAVGFAAAGLAASVIPHGRAAGPNRSAAEDAHGGLAGNGSDASAPSVPSSNAGRTSGLAGSQQRPSDGWRSVCNDAIPGADAPAWARSDLYRLFLGPQLAGADPPPGGLIAGCPSQTYTTPRSSGGFVYIEGTSTFDQLLSVAVDSRRYGPAIFLAPAARPVLRLINQGNIIGGFPRIDAGSGDAYGVETARGTVLLLRRLVSCAHFDVLLPSAATAWIAAVRRVGSWLWPLTRRHVAGGLRLRLLDPRTGRISPEIIRSSPNGLHSSLIRGPRTLGVYGPMGIKIAESELKWWAEKSR